jgi:predicted SprT family Zn-dependent metalloprotease
MPSERVVRQTPPTAASAQALQTAYDFFNKKLFDGKLPPCILLLHRKRNANGYFWAERFADRADKTKLDEIAINPSEMRGRDDRAVLSTLVHEMCHLEQQHFGKAPKGNYHDKQWGEMMDRVGLTPTSTGKPGGKRTGAKVTHLIVDGGPFDVACKALLKTGLTLPYMERNFTKAEKARAKVKRASKTKFVCPDCDQACWGKPTLQVICADCMEPMEEA